MHVIMQSQTHQLNNTGIILKLDEPIAVPGLFQSFEFGPRLCIIHVHVGIVVPCMVFCAVKI